MPAILNVHMGHIMPRCPRFSTSANSEIHEEAFCKWWGQKVTAAQNHRQFFSLQSIEHTSDMLLPSLIMLQQKQAHILKQMKFWSECFSLLQKKIVDSENVFKKLF